MRASSTLGTIPAALLLAVAGTAQNPAVSPAHYATEEGATTSSFPFSNPVRYQQVHADLRGPARIVLALSFRRDGMLGPRVNFAPRTLQLEVRMSESDLPTMSATFANNYATPASVVLPATSLTTPDFVDQPRTVPGPFAFRIPLQVPFAYTGTRDLLWEVAVTSATGTGTAVPLDAPISGFNLVTPGAYTMNGLGCMVQGLETMLRANHSVQSLPNGSFAIFDFTASFLPPSAACAFLFGSGAVNLPVPGVCTNLYVLPLVTLNGTADATGTFKPFTGVLPRLPFSNAIVGQSFDAQVAGLDPGMTPVPVRVTNGVTARIPATPPTLTGVFGRVYEPNNPNAAVATNPPQPGSGTILRID